MLAALSACNPTAEPGPEAGTLPDWYYNALLADRTLPAAEKIAAVTAIYNELGMADACREAIDGYYAEARRHLERINAPSGETEALWAYAASLLNRTV